MPSIPQTFDLKVTVERFLASCSETELQELELLLPRELRRRGLI